MWQDFVIMGISFMYAVFLIPQLRDVLNGARVNLATTSLTGIGLLIMAYTYSTVGWWAAFVSSVIAAGMWLTLFYCSWRNR
jgi:type II secretory pathway component PulF